MAEPRRNVEIKARVRDERCLVEKAMDIAAPEAMIHQTDTFFGTDQGRLKLRVETNGTDHINSYLILYKRADEAESKLSTFVTCQIPEPVKFMNIMTASNGIYTQTVDKIRRVFIHTDRPSSIKTRIHIDNVSRLGCFMELEVMLPHGIDESVGHRIAGELKEALGIEDEDLIKGAYFDMLVEKDGGEQEEYLAKGFSIDMPVGDEGQEK